MDVSSKISVSMMITIICCSICMGALVAWIAITSTALSSSTAFYGTSNINVNHTIIDKSYPVIEVENQRITVGAQFDPKSWITVTDVQDGDITVNVNVYGEINNQEKGEYEIRYSVRNSLGLKADKKIKVIVD